MWCFVLALPIFPCSHPQSIFGANELNFRVRNGNGWTLIAINTNYVLSAALYFVAFRESSIILTRGRGFVKRFFSKKEKKMERSMILSIPGL